MVAARVFGIGQEPISGDAVVILKDDENKRYLHLVIGLAEARAIAAQLENLTPPRPLTHDLLASVIKHMGGTIEGVLVSELREHTFFARLRIRHNGRTVEVDSRPSDAIALAVTCEQDVPIFVAEEVLDDVSA